MAYKKCPRCAGCMSFKHIKGYLFLYCDFCKQWYQRLPQMKLEKVDNLDEYVKGLP